MIAPFRNFCSDQLRWLQFFQNFAGQAINRNDCTFLRLLLAVNRDDWKKAETFLRLLLAINRNDCSFLANNWDDCSFSKLLLAINRDDFLSKRTKTTFASGISRWLTKADTFLRLLLAINRNGCIFLRLLLAINRNDCTNFFSNTLLRIATTSLRL